MKKLLLTLFTIILLALSVGCSDDNSYNNNSNTKTVQLGKIYEDEANGFSLNLPDHWEYLSTSTAQTFLNPYANNIRLLFAYDSLEKDNIGNVGVIVDKYLCSDEFSFEIISESYLKEQCAESNATFDSFAEFPIDDIPAKKTTYSLTNYKDENLSVSEYYYAIGDAVYVARFFFPLSKEEEYAHTFDAMKSSYSIKGLTEQETPLSTDANKEDVLVDIYRSAIMSITNEQLELPTDTEQLIRNNFEQFAIWKGGEKDAVQFQELTPDELYPWDQVDGNRTPYVRSDVVLHRDGTVLVCVSEEIENGSGIYLSVVQLLYDNMMAAKGAQSEQLYTLLFLGNVDYQPGDYIGFYGVPIGYYTIDNETESYLIVTGCFD